MRTPRKPQHGVAVLVWAVVLAINAIAVSAPACRAEERADGKGVVAVDYTKLARSLVRSPHNPVLKVGDKGTWNDQTLSCFTVLDDGYHLWYLGSGPYGGKTAWRIGHATSPDGVKWTKSGEEPVLDIGKHGDETKMIIQIGHGTSQSKAEGATP